MKLPTARHASPGEDAERCLTRKRKEGNKRDRGVKFEKKRVRSEHETSLEAYYFHEVRGIKIKTES